MLEILERAALADQDGELLLEMYADARSAETAAFGWPPEAIAAFLQMQFRMQQSGYARAYPGAEHNILLLAGEAVGQWRVLRAARGLSLIDIALLKRFRGRGIGSTLIQRLVAEAARECVPLRLSVRSDSRAQALYRRLGFEELSRDAANIAMLWRPVRANAQGLGPRARPRVG